MAMNTLFFAFLGPWEIAGILGVALLMFGAKKLPELARGLGQGIKEFKRASRDVQSDLQRAIDNIEEDSSLPGPTDASNPVEPPSSSKPEPTAAPAWKDRPPASPSPPSSSKPEPTAGEPSETPKT